MSDLILPLKREYFELIKNGSKQFEYRLFNDYWRKRIEGKNYDRIVLTLGYPRKDDSDRRIVRVYKKPEVITIQHPHFGNEPVKVYSFDVSIGENC